MGEFRFSRNQAGTDYFLVKTRRPDILADLGKNVPVLTHTEDWWVFGPNTPNTPDTR